MCGTLEEQKQEQATPTAKAIFCRCALWASLLPSAERKAAGAAGLNAQAYLRSKDNSNNRSLRDDKQERQKQIHGFFASLRKTTLAGVWCCCCGLWLQTPAGQGHVFGVEGAAQDTCRAFFGWRRCANDLMRIGHGDVGQGSNEFVSGQVRCVVITFA